MATPPVPDEKLKTLVALWDKLNRNTCHLAKALNLPRSTVAHRLDNARRRGFIGAPPKPRIRVKAGSAPVDAPIPEPDAVDERRGLDERAVLRQRVAALERRIIAEEAWRQRFTSLHGTADEPVDWLPTPAIGRQNSMIPVLFTSDFQCGEVVRPEEIDGINAYNQEIFIDRYQRMIEKTVDLARNCTGATDFPYAVYLRGGDAISGEIHDELAQTNDLSSVPALRLLQQQEREGIRKLRSEFGRVRVISIAGNHGRTVHKPHAKGYTERSYETLLSWWLADTFEGDPNVTFYTPKSGEALFEVAGWNWLMAHGDRMGSKGGKGFIGPSATIARGHAKLYQNWAATGRRLDLILTGHLHTSVKLERGYANGSIVGYNEFARDIQALPDTAKQWLLFAHEKHMVSHAFELVLSERPQRMPAFKDAGHE